VPCAGRPERGDDDAAPRRVEWATLHRRELLENWDLAKARKAMKPIAPLD